MKLYSDSNIDCWLSRLNKVENLCKIPQVPSYIKTEKVKISIKKKMQSIFERFYIDQINDCKASNVDNVNHNKLRTYATLKGSFTREPYIDLVQSRNQRSWLSRLRCSAHHLEIEKGRWNKTPISERICKLCDSGSIGDEFHFAMKCPTFNIKRACFIGKVNSIIPGFKNMSSIDQFKTVMCPTVAAVCKVTNQFFRIMFLARDNLIEGVSITELSYPTMPVNSVNSSFDNFSDVELEDEWDEFLSNISDSSFSEP